MQETGTGAPPAGWDDHLERWSGHMLQSRSWANFQIANGRRLVWSWGADWSWMALVRRSKGIRYLESELGPTIGNSTALGHALASLGTAATKHGAAYVLIQPVGVVRPDDLLERGLRPAPRGWSQRHQTTSVIDLTRSEPALRAACSKGHRGCIGAASRKHVACREASSSADLEVFARMLKETGSRGSWKASDEAYLTSLFTSLEASGAARLYLAEVQGELAAGCLVLCFRGTWYYAFAGGYEGPGRRAGAGVVLVWRAMMDAKAAGAHTFDLWGVAPLHEPDSPWAGFSRFKRAFGGQDLERVGTWYYSVSKRFFLRWVLWWGKKEVRDLEKALRSLRSQPHVRRH